jgi:alpha-galactosidase
MRGIVAGIAVVGFVASALVGVFQAWAILPPDVDTTASVRVVGELSALFSVPRSSFMPLNTGLAMTPPMGWNGYNRFHRAVTAAMVEAAARALVSSGMKAAGYTYVNLDGGWDLPRRNARGTLQPDPAKFPQGIKPVADYVHSLGLKFGIYASAGTQNCAATSAGSYGHYRLDAATFASWGVDYIKLDWCSIPYRSHSQLTHLQLNEMLAAQMASALAVTGRAIVFDINNPANDHPRGSAHGLANMWRTTPDIQDTYPSMIMNFTHNVNQLERGPGGWNDPDMLEIGNGGMTFTEYQSQLSLWAEMAAPLIAGNDLSTMSRATRSILTNLAVIAVDQDRLGRQGYPVASANGHWVLTKPLANGDRAVVLFNQTDSSATISTTLAQVGLTSSASYTLLNLWSGAATETAGVITASVPPHGVVFYGIAKSATRPFTT